METPGMHGRVAVRKIAASPGTVPLTTDHPNQIWPVDYKGQFKTRDEVYCYPLTVTDHDSRKLLVYQALPSVGTEGAMPVFERLFREIGLPEAIRTDNDVSFASIGIHGLCALNVWWMKQSMGQCRRIGGYRRLARRRVALNLPSIPANFESVE